MLDPEKIGQIVEAALFAADEPLTVEQLVKLFRAQEVDEEAIRGQVRDALKSLMAQSADRGYELRRVASGFRYQVRQDLSVWVSRLWEEKPPRYSRALMETLALVAYKQPVTRGDIEQVRGVTVSQNIMRTLLERDWVRVVGQREVPGRPAMYGTTRAFLDYFNLKSLDQLPPLAEIRELIEPVIVEEVGPPAGFVGVASADVVSADEPSADEPSAEVVEAATVVEVAAVVVEAREAKAGSEPSALSSQAQALDAAAAEAEPAAPEPTRSEEAPAEASDDTPELPTAQVVQLPTAHH